VTIASASDKNKAYSDVMTWRGIADAHNRLLDLRLTIKKQGIFFPKDLRDKFSVAVERLFSVVVERQMSFDHEEVREWKRSEEFLKDGEAWFQGLMSATSDRLFRE
jgi:hypothetical protein